MILKSLSLIYEDGRSTVMAGCKLLYESATGRVSWAMSDLPKAIHTNKIRVRFIFIARIFRILIRFGVGEEITFPNLRNKFPESGARILSISRKIISYTLTQGKDREGRPQN
jgi:hypothetical protein